MEKILKPDFMMGQAGALKRVTDDLQNTLNQLLPISEQQAVRLWGYTVSTVMLRALATELILKALSFKKAGKYRKDRKGHDLLVLFKDLDCDTRKLVSKLAEAQGIMPLEQILGKHKDDFLAWRYVTEGGTQKVDVLDLDKAFHILMNAYIHRDFLKPLNSELTR